LACLIETGELPTLGGEATAATICSEQFQEFSLDQGRPLLASGGDGSGSDGSSRGRSRGSKGSATGEGARATRVGGSGGSRRVGGAGRNGRFRGGRGEGGSGGAGGAGGDGDDDDTYTGSNKAGLSGIGGSKSKSVKVRRVAGIGGGYFGKDEDEEKKRKPVSASVRKKSGIGAEKPEALKVKKPLKKQGPPRDDEGLSFGGFLRIFVIAAIIIALLVLLGGQALQIGKSME